MKPKYIVDNFIESNRFNCPVSYKNNTIAIKRNLVHQNDWRKVMYFVAIEFKVILSEWKRPTRGWQTILLTVTRK